MIAFFETLWIVQLYLYPQIHYPFNYIVVSSIYLFLLYLNEKEETSYVLLFLQLFLMFFLTPYHFPFLLAFTVLFHLGMDNFKYST